LLKATGCCKLSSGTLAIQGLWNNPYTNYKLRALVKGGAPFGLRASSFAQLQVTEMQEKAVFSMGASTISCLNDDCTKGCANPPCWQASGFEQNNIELSWTPALYDWASGGRKVDGTKSENGNKLTNRDGDCSSGVCTGGTYMVRESIITRVQYSV
jgi:hypothetical protein